MDHEQTIAELQTRVEELENSWKRALADYKNLEKRVLEEKSEFAEFANYVLISRLIPVLDNLEMMAKHHKDAGIEMVLRDFKKVLEEEGVSEIPTEGKEFDAHAMDALELVEGESENEGKVVETVRKGYKFKSKKVLRPATVKVGAKKEDKDA